jgi:hypothetical protein
MLSDEDDVSQIGHQSEGVSWPKVVLSARNHARLIEDFGVSSSLGLAEQFALLRPDLYGAGLLNLNSIDDQLSSLGLRAVFSQKVAA